MWKATLPLLCAALLIGWFLPDVAEPQPQAAAAVQANVVLPKPAAATAADDLDDEITEQEDGIILQRQSDGHFYADVDVDGKQIRFLVDTGATGIALTAEDASALGLEWDQSELQTIGSGASGAVRGTMATLGNVQLGGVEAENVNAAIVPDGLGVSLLGQSFLSQAESVVIRGDKMKIN